MRKITEDDLRRAAWVTLAIGLTVLFTTIKLGGDALVTDAKSLPSLCSSGRQVITGSVESIEVTNEYTVFRINVPVKVLARNRGKYLLESREVREVREGEVLTVEGNSAESRNTENENTEENALPVIFADRIYLQKGKHNGRDVSISR